LAGPRRARPLKRNLPATAALLSRRRRRPTPSGDTRAGTR
jgi:hypothetical protein